MGQRQRFLYVALLAAAGFLAGPRAEAFSREEMERQRALRLRTAGRAEFLPDLMPPSGPLWPGILPLSGDVRIRWRSGAGMDRVDGLRPVVRVELLSRGSLPYVDVYAAHGITSGRWSGAGLVGVRLGSQVRLGARLYEETATWPDAVRPVTAEENFLAAAFMREDFFSFLRRRGGSLIFSWRPERGRETQIALTREEHRAVARARGRLGPFGGKKRFRDNPAVPEATWGFVRARELWTARPKSEAWEREEADAALAEVMVGAVALGSEYDFFRLYLELRGRRRLTLGQFFGYKLALGAGEAEKIFPDKAADDVAPGFERPPAEPDLPLPWQFRAGGVGTLRSQDFESSRGDRLVLLTLEYGFEAAPQVRPVLFLDTGRTWAAAFPRAGGLWNSGPFHVGGGVGLQLGTGPLSGRLDVARDLRENRAPARVTLRLGYPY